MPGLRTLNRCTSIARKCSLLLLALTTSGAAAGPALPAGAPENSETELLRQAEESFAQGVGAKQDLSLARKYFTQAARKFSLLHARGVHNADLYLDWGNAELLAERVPQAILAYRRGLRLAPGRRDLVDNLTLARQRLPHPPVADAAPPRVDAWMSLVPGLAGHVRLLLFLGTVLAYSLASFSFIRWLRLRLTLLPGRAVLLLLLAGTSGFFWQREEARLQDQKLHPLVVIAQETGFLRGNGLSYPAHPTIPTLYPGMEARRLFQRGDWLQVQLPGGALGWVPAEAVLIDES